MGFQVALKVEDFEFILLSQVQQFAQSRIRVDDLLVHQGVFFGVAADASGDFRAAQRCAFSNAKECAESIRDGSGFCEHSFLFGFINTALSCYRGFAAATFLRTFEFTGNRFFQLFHAGEDSAQCGTESVDLFNKAVEFRDDIDRFRD